MKRKISAIVDQFRGDNLKARCARSGVVLGVGVTVAKGLAFSSKVVLARLLVPQELGLMVLVLSITSLFQVLTEIGIKQSVIQNKNGAQSEYLNMAWWFQSLRGVGLYVVAFFVAPFLCQFYFANRPEVLAVHTTEELLAIVRVAFLAIPFWGFISPRVYVLEKEFRFGKKVVLTQGSTVIGAIVTIVLAIVMRDVWALVIGFASMGLVECLLSYILCPFRPRLSFDWESFQHIYRFARGVFGLPVLTYVAFNIDVLVAGKLIAADLLGMYGWAFILARMPRELFARIVSPILLPAFSEKQDDKEALRRAVLKITRVTALFAIPLVALAIICSKTVLSLVYGEQYSAVAVPFSLLCVYALLLIIGTILGNLFFGIGQPAKHRAFVGIRVAILIALIYPAIKSFGLTGAAAVVLLASTVALCVQVVIMRKEIGLNIYDYAISWVPGLALAIPVLAVVVVVRGFTPDSPMVHLIIGALSCIIVCGLGLLLPKFLDRRQRHKQAGASAVGLAGAEEAESG